MSPSLRYPVHRVPASLLLLLASVLWTGCDDLPSDPTPSQRIFGRWVSIDSTQVAAHFRGMGARQMQMEFESDGLYTVRFSGTPRLNGSYLTRPGIGVLSDLQRAIEMTVSGGATGNYAGAYRIEGDTMLIEIVPASESGMTSTPDEDRPLPNAVRNGQATTDYISRLVREP